MFAAVGTNEYLMEDRVIEFTAFYMSQHDFKCDDLLSKLEQSSNESIMTSLFQPLLRMSYDRKLKG